MHNPETHAIALLTAAKHCLAQMPDRRLVGYCQALISRVEDPASREITPADRAAFAADADEVRRTGADRAVEIITVWERDQSDTRLLREVALDIYRHGYSTAMDAITPAYVALDQLAHLN